MTAPEARNQETENNLHFRQQPKSKPGSIKACVRERNIKLRASKHLKLVYK